MLTIMVGILSKLKFKVIGDLQGGIDALTNGEADYFMWEHFTTKPLVDNGTFRRLGDCPTPWPCFVVAVRNEILENHPEKVKEVLDIINNCTNDFKKIDNIDKTLSKTLRTTIRRYSKMVIYYRMECWKTNYKKLNYTYTK